MLLVERVQEFIDRKEFPSDAQFVELFCDDLQFTDQEDVNWDFKDRWPFSYSDDYFLGIARLVSALANTYGGFIVFGVHDTDRKGGHNKVKINLDRLRISIGQYMTDCPDLNIRHYDTPSGGVDCLFVVPRPMGVPPYRFSRDTKYKRTIWVREGSSVVKAEARHAPLIYCRVHDVSNTDADETLSGSVPPSLRTVGKFIGRMESLDYLFNWLYRSDEPQTYIFGKGGSGKTTVAHEFASSIKQFGANIRIYGGDAIDLVLFLSAKEKRFVPADKNGIQTTEADFFDEKSLYAQLLMYSGLYTSEDQLAEKDVNSLRKLIVEFFDEFSSIIILDDIDTLTTKNIEVGTNFLYRTLARAKRTSKILCTQRNIPTHAISNSLEVPGLSADEEYPEYVAECTVVAPQRSDMFSGFERDAMNSRGER